MLTRNGAARLIFFYVCCWGRLGCSARELDGDGDELGMHGLALRTLASLEGCCRCRVTKWEYFMNHCTLSLDASVALRLALPRHWQQEGVSFLPKKTVDIYMRANPARKELREIGEGVTLGCSLLSMDMSTPLRACLDALIFSLEWDVT